MARRKKSSPVEDLVDLISLLPWYVGVALALLSYVILHRVAVAPMTAALKPGDITAGMTGAIGRGLTGVAQYAVPAVCLVGAAVSAWRRRARRALIDNVTRSEAPNALDNMTWREFEMLVGEGFRLQGYNVVENSAPGPDDGIDLRLRRNGEMFLVQCKQWRAFKVGVQVVRELYGVMAAKGAVGGFVVTSGRFTAEADAFADGRNVRLIDGPKLERMLQHARRNATAPSNATASPKPPRTEKSPNVSGVVPACPKCASPMAKRTASKGANAGQDFWGCSSFPKCRGTRTV